MKLNSTTYLGLVTITIIATICYYGSLKYYRYKFEEAKIAGYPAVAAYYADKVLDQMVHDQKDCEAIIQVYNDSGKTEQGNLAAQRCLMNKIETPLAYLLVSDIQEKNGQWQNAINLLLSQAHKFPKAADLYYKVYKLALKHKQFQTAVEAIQIAVERLPTNNSLQLEALELYYQTNNKDLLAKLALKLSALNVEDLKFNLLMATAFQYSQQDLLFKKFKAISIDMLSKTSPLLQQQLAQEFSHLFVK